MSQGVVYKTDIIIVAAQPLEFDYSGWKNWSRWRRDGPRNKAALVTDLPADTEDGDITTKKKDCWNTCDYPSECKWGKKFGIHTPVETGFPVVEADAKPALNSLADTTLKGNPTTENYEDAKTLRKSGTLNLWTALVASVERRKNGSVRLSSPLSVITQGETARKRAGKTALSPQENKGNMIIAVTELSVLGTTSDSTLFDSSDSSTAGDSFKPLLSRRRYRRTTSSPKTRANSDAKRAELYRGKTRLAKWYAPYSDDEKVKLKGEVHRLIAPRDQKESNFWIVLIPPDMARVVVDTNDNELAYLEAIHFFVEVLDAFFGNVCELDLVFNFLVDAIWKIEKDKIEM
ncbi:hypothetical protein BM1_06308 [Bipolaris maydis]|nr:hypothetical protein BM1_06308 [Bipolaris maydis]